MAARLNILLVEDHALIREGLKLLINNQPDMHVIGEAGDGEKAVQMAVDQRPDVVLMDITLPVLNGIQATRRLHEKNPGIKVLGLTVHEDTGYLREMIQNGASGYVPKRAAADVLIHAIHIVSAGGTYLDVAMLFPGGKQGGSPPEPDPIPQVSLSAREKEVARWIALGYSNKEIAAQLKISAKTIETYKYRVMEKLGLSNRADFVRYAMQQGWLKGE